MADRNAKRSRAKRILPPFRGGVTHESVARHFKNQKVYFLTINPHKKHKHFQRFQSISKVSDRLRARCRMHFIVQEDYKDGGKHYHAIAVGYKNDPIVGLRVHCQVVGPKVNSPEFDPEVEPKRPEGVDPSELPYEFPQWIQFNPMELIDWVYVHSIRQKEKMISQRQGLKARVRNKKRSTHLQRVIKYILKDNPVIQYKDWMFCPKN